LLILARASFAQERILLDEQIRFSSNDKLIYNLQFAFYVSSDDNAGSIPIERLRRALEKIVMTHKSLSTKLYFDTNGVPMQRVPHMTDLNTKQVHYGFTILDVDANADRNNTEIFEKIQHSIHFDLKMGHVVHCHIVRHSHSSNLHNEHVLKKGDLIVLNIHHSVFDGVSTAIFLRDLSLAYKDDTSFLVENNNNTLQYIDYSVYERRMDMSASKQFWQTHLDGYDLQRSLTIRTDRYRLSNDQRSGLATVVELSFDNDLSKSFFAFASSSQVTPFQLGLASFYAFLFKLTNGQNDLCVTCLNANRYRAELRDMIGMFVATLPYRIQINPSDTFNQLVKQVQEQCLSILEHSHYPLQHILADSHHQQSNTAFLETLFDFITLTPDVEKLSLGETQLDSLSLNQIEDVAKFDLACTFFHNPATQNNIMSCSLICSQDLYDPMTVQIMADRFSYFLHQLFSPSATSSTLSITNEALYKLSIILPTEQKLLQSLNNLDSNIDQQQTHTIGHVFSQQASYYSQKLAVELDEQSLTYNELYFIIQRVSLYLLNNHNIIPGEIICQCVERGLSMVS
jgi:hypothetical protein